MLCTETHVAHIQTKFCQTCPHNKKGWAGLYTGFIIFVPIHHRHIHSCQYIVNITRATNIMVVVKADTGVDFLVLYGFSFYTVL
jgi:hypothetical protein